MYGALFMKMISQSLSHQEFTHNAAIIQSSINKLSEQTMSKVMKFPSEKTVVIKFEK